MKLYGAELKRRRESAGMTTRRLGDRIDRSSSYVTDFELARKSNPPEPEMMQRLANALDWPVADQLQAWGYAVTEDPAGDEEGGPDARSNESEAMREFVAMLRQVKLNPEREAFLRGVLGSMLDFDRMAAREDASPPKQRGVA